MGQAFLSQSTMEGLDAFFGPNGSPGGEWVRVVERVGVGVGGLIIPCCGFVVLVVVVDRWSWLW